MFFLRNAHMLRKKLWLNDTAKKAQTLVLREVSRWSSRVYMRKNDWRGLDERILAARLRPS